MTLEKFLPTLTEAKKQRLEELGFTPEEFVEAYIEHKAYSSDEHPSVYCGTYAKYNNSSLEGQWIDLTTFGGDYDDFINYCKALHADEQDPELMFQDAENFPDQWYDECPSEADFENIIEYFEMCEEFPSEAVDAYISLYGEIDIDHFRKTYQGEWDSEEDFAEHFITEQYGDYFDRLPSIIASNIDWDGVAQDLFSYDFDFEDGYVFRK